MTAPRPTGASAPTPPSASLFPGYFALGDGHRNHRHRCGPAGTRLARPTRSSPSPALAYVVLAVLMARARPLPAPLVADLTSHAKGFAFLTAVAATNVLGGRLGVIHGWWGLAWVLWFVGCAMGGARSTPR